MKNSIMMFLCVFIPNVYAAQYVVVNVRQKPESFNFKVGNTDLVIAKSSIEKYEKHYNKNPFDIKMEGKYPYGNLKIQKPEAIAIGRVNLANIYQIKLAEILKNKLNKTIGIAPIIGAGLPEKEAVTIALTTTLDFLRKNEMGFKKVVFCVEEDAEFVDYNNILKQLLVENVEQKIMT